MKLADAVQLLKDKGYKQTDKREDLLEVFASNRKYLSAKDVLEVVKAKHPNLSYDTIYRNLSLFAEMGILENTELSGEKHFRISCGLDHHHHHFICTKCGCTKEIKACPLESIEENLENFEITGHKFEIYGICPNCS